MFPTLEDIARRRRQLGLKQGELAKAAGVSQSLIAKLEAGSIDSSYTKVKTIFDVPRPPRIQKQSSSRQSPPKKHNHSPEK